MNDLSCQLFNISSEWLSLFLPYFFSWHVGEPHWSAKCFRSPNNLPPILSKFYCSKNLILFQWPHPWRSSLLRAAQTKCKRRDDFVSVSETKPKWLPLPDRSTFLLRLQTFHYFTLRYSSHFSLWLRFSSSTSATKTTLICAVHQSIFHEFVNQQSVS